MKYQAVKKAANLPSLPGVYVFRDEEGNVIYVGKAINLKKRVSSYFSRKNHPRTESLASAINDISATVTENEFEALILEANLIRSHQPKYNVIWKDDKSYLYIRISRDEYPRITLSRNAKDQRAYHFGPFPSSRTVKEVLLMLRKVFPYCQETKTGQKACFYTHLGLCNPCPNVIDNTEDSQLREKLKKEYLSNIRSIRSVLKGNTGKVLKLLEKEMEEFSNSGKFEEAARARDKIIGLKRITASYIPSSVYIENPQYVSENRNMGLDLLGKELASYFPGLVIRSAECYDISTISGNFSVGSMVRFEKLDPVKAKYRKFRIKTVKGQNDFAMLNEIIKRRLLHKEWEYPDLIIIDGGKPQLEWLKGTLSEYHIPYFGIAKKNDTLVIPTIGGYSYLSLDKASQALHFVQRIRDEAHRFAHGYNTLLRRKSIRL